MAGWRLDVAPVDPGGEHHASPVGVVAGDAAVGQQDPAIRRWAKRNKVEVCFTPTSASWANPIEAQFGPLRSFVLGDSQPPPKHIVLAGSCGATWAGVTSTPAALTCWSPNAASASACAASASASGPASATSRMIFGNANPPPLSGERWLAWPTARRGAPTRRPGSVVIL